MNTFAVSARDVQRNYKQVVERVRKKKEAAVLMSQREAQAVIVSIEDFQELQEMRKKNSAQNLLDWAHEMRELLKGEELPTDLSIRHDYYLWEEGNNGQ